MSLLDLVRGKERPAQRKEPVRRRRGERGRGRTSAERMAKLEASYLNTLRRERPEEFNKLMRRRVERQFGVEDESGELGQLAKTLGQLKELGLLNGQLGGQGSESWIKDAVDGVRMLLRYQQPAPSEAPATNGVQYAEAPATIPALPEASSTSSTSSTVVAPPFVRPLRADVKVSVASAYLISQIDGKTPGDAAEWLVKQERPEARELVSRLCSTPDALHMALLDQVASEAPDVAGFIAWVKARPDVLAAVVQELRIRTQQFPPLHPSQNVGM